MVLRRDQAAFSYVQREIGFAALARLELLRAFYIRLITGFCTPVRSVATTYRWREPKGKFRCVIRMAAVPLGLARKNPILGVIVTGECFPLSQNPREERMN